MCLDNFFRGMFRLTNSLLAYYIFRILVSTFECLDGAKQLMLTSLLKTAHAKTALVLSIINLLKMAYTVALKKCLDANILTFAS